MDDVELIMGCHVEVKWLLYLCHVEVKSQFKVDGLMMLVLRSSSTFKLLCFHSSMIIYDKA